MGGNMDSEICSLTKHEHEFVRVEFVLFFVWGCSLQQLYLSGNCLQQLWYPDSSSSTADHHHKDTEFKPFAALRCLLLAGNKISEWSSVDALDQFPALEVL
jgi:hypothetical protein